MGGSQRIQTDALSLMIFLIISLMPQGYFLMLYSPVMVSTHYRQSVVLSLLFIFELSTALALKKLGVFFKPCTFVVLSDDRYCLQRQCI